MIKDDLNKLIMDSMKSHDNVRTEVLRSFKTAILNWKSAEGNSNFEYTDEVEQKLLKGLLKQYNATAKECNDGKHDDLVKTAIESAEIVSEFLPEAITPEQIQSFVETLEIKPVKKNIGQFMKAVKAKYPDADGKMVSQVVMKILQ